ncbi:hypothetical protein [uncultured Mucilaginibacter sp.]|uniref:hypothetical protein n=1 Tax=uncultured Mucilaginibacter sp. TaxID=797541 RepID=UPI002629B54B|nr:hypothetical protein [uncultured Mucilaginibacter sp.]
MAKHLKTEFIGIKEALETFTDKNLNRLLTNVRDSFGNKASTATIAEVKAVQIKKQ